MASICYIILKMIEGGTLKCLGRKREESDLRHHAHKCPQTEHLQRHAHQILHREGEREREDS